MSDLSKEINYPRALQGWEMTDPRNHNPDFFRYIVHSLPDDEDLSESLAMDHFRAGEESGYNIDKPIDLREDPEGFLKRKYISSSVIDQTHMATTGTTGVILTVPRENIILAKSSDAGVTYHPEVYRLDRRTDIPDALEIVRNSNDYNEVLISGESLEGTKIDYAGVFTFVYAPGKSTRPDLDEKIREFAKKHRLPIIELS